MLRPLPNPLPAVLLSLLVMTAPPAGAGTLSDQQAAQAERVLGIKRLQQRLLMSGAFERAHEPGLSDEQAEAAFRERQRLEEPGIARPGISQRPSPETAGERAAFSRLGRAAGPLTANRTLSYATNVPVNNPDLDNPSRGDAQSEPSVAALGNNVLVGWNDGRGSTFQSGASLPNLLNYGYSTDGGQTFTTGPASGPTALPVLLLGGIWTSDPVISVNEKTGDFYFCGLFDPPNSGTGPDENGVAVARATFSGNTVVWNRPVVVRSLPQEVQDLIEIDKPWIFADSTTGNLYLTYTRYTIDYNRPVPTIVDSILFTRSTDQGAHWSPSITLSSVAAAGWVQGSRPVAGPTGELYVTWKEIGQTASGLDYMRIRRSDNRGLSFANEQTATTFFDNFGTGAPGFNREQGITLPSITVDRSTGPYSGNVYVAWNESVNYYDSIPDSSNAPVLNEPESATATTGSDDTPATAVPFTPGTAIRGSFNQQFDQTTASYTDLDYYRFSATRGTSYVFWANELPTRYTLRILGTDGVTRLAFSGDRFGSPPNPGFILWTCPKSGTYYMRMAIFGTTPGYYRVDTGIDAPGGPNQRARDQRDVFVTSSPDGTSWSTPVMVSAPEPGLFDDWLPEVAVAGPNGTLYSMWYDFSDSPLASDGGQSQTYMARSDDAGATWASLGPVSDTFVNWTYSNSNIIPNQGDYVSLFASPTTVIPCWTDAREGTPDIWAAPFSLTAIQVAIEAVTADTNSVTLTWHASGPYPASAEVLRADGTGPYQVISSPSVVFDASGRVTYVDPTVLSGSQYRYALQLTVGSSTEILGERTVLTPGHERPAFSFLGATPNPTKKGLRVQFTLPDNVSAELRLYDLNGRPLRERSYQGAGAYDFDFGAGLDLKPGVYFLRLTRGGNDSVRRVSIIP